ncbi:MAG: DUF4236 domain-containing protein [Planctomycetota bacterium]
MGFYYRKSVGLGPFRLNLSKGGFGFSAGGPGFRTGISSSGRKYQTFSIPGTGLGYRSSGGKRGCAVTLATLAGIACAAAATARGFA